jgi:hypothetical protein
VFDLVSYPEQRWAFIETKIDVCSLNQKLEYGRIDPDKIKYWSSHDYGIEKKKIL